MGEPILSIFSIERLYPTFKALSYLDFCCKSDTRISERLQHNDLASSVMGHDWGQFLLQTTTTFITGLSPDIFILRMCKVQATPLGFQMPPSHSNSLVISSFEKSHEPNYVSGQWLKLAVYCPKPGMEGVNFTHLYIYHFWPNNSPFRLLTVPWAINQGTESRET